MNRLTRLRQILAEDPQLDSVSDAEEFRAELIKLELLEACRRVNEDCDALNCEEIRAILAPVLAAARDDQLCTCGIAPGKSVPAGDVHAASCPLFRRAAPRAELSAALERAINMLDDWKAGRPFGLYAQAAVDELRAKLFCHGEWAERKSAKGEGA